MGEAVLFQRLVIGDRLQLKGERTHKLFSCTHVGGVGWRPELDWGILCLDPRRQSTRI